MELFKKGLDYAKDRFCEKFALVFSFLPVLLISQYFLPP